MSFNHLWPRPLMSNQLRQMVKSRPTSTSLHKLGTEINLKKVISEKTCASRLLSHDFRKNHGGSRVCDITVDMIYEGLPDIPCLVCETTTVDEDKVIRLQGYSIPECCKLLPAAKTGSQPMPEGLFWLLMTGDMPTHLQTESISKEWSKRAHLQPHVVKMIKMFPTNLHPMTQLSAAVTALVCESKFRQAYSGGVHKVNYWEYVYEDSMDLIASLPTVIALIHNNYTHQTTHPEITDYNEDWSANFTKLLGYNNPDFIDFLRFYICFGHDNDRGNASMHAAHSVGSTLSDPYLAFASSLNLLAGPLLSNEKSVLFLKNIQRSVGIDSTDKKLDEFVKSAMLKSNDNTFNLLHTDPRFDYFQEFCNKHLHDDPLFKLANQLVSLGHGHLVTVDVLTATIFEFYEVKPNFRPVIASLSHLVRIASSLVWDRALGYPIEYPISLSTNCLMKACQYRDAPVQAM